MTQIDAFERWAVDYDKWFKQHNYAYQSELDAVRKLLPQKGTGVEIGAGTGRFAIPLGVPLGIEPSLAMRTIAREKGLEVIEGTAEAPPLESNKYDYLLYVTTLCFLDSLTEAFREARRILKPGGNIIIGLIDKESAAGKSYEQTKESSRFYQQATFHSVDSVMDELTRARFTDFVFAQTLFTDPEQLDHREAVKEGYGEGAFVVLRGKCNK